MRRRKFLSMMLAAASSAVLVARRAVSQTEKVPRRIGFLWLSSTTAIAKPVQALRDGLRERGHVEGRDIVIDFRTAGGRAEALPGLAAELAALNPSVIMAAGTIAAHAARAAAPAVPIVALTGDLTAAGLATGFGRPDSGVTGVSFLSSSLDAKRLQLLAELLPKGSAVLNILDPSARTGAERSIQAAGRSLGLVLHTVDARTTREIEMAFATASKLRVAGVNVLSSPLLNSNRARIIELAAAAKLPAIYQWPETAEEGGLMGYGPRLTVVYRQLAAFVSRILEGAKPADLPIEQPTKIELVINLKTAKALGLTVPQSLLLRADEVIQ
jgi:putative ABC transport system substrate-binding protein